MPQRLSYDHVQYVQSNHLIRYSLDIAWFTMAETAIRGVGTTIVRPRAIRGDVVTRQRVMLDAAASAEVTSLKKHPDAPKDVSKTCFHSFSILFQKDLYARLACISKNVPFRTV